MQNFLPRVAVTLFALWSVVSASDAVGTKDPRADNGDRPRAKSFSQVREQAIDGRVVLKSDPKQGVPGAVVRCLPLDLPMGFLNAVSDSEGKFQAMRGACAMLVQARTQDGTQSGIVVLPADAAKVTIPVGPIATAHGRLLDRATGQPLAGRVINYGVRVNFARGGFVWGFGKSATTDARGEFTLTELVPGWTFDVNTWTKQAAGKASTWTLGSLTPKGPGLFDLGEVMLGPSDPPTRGAKPKPIFDPKTDANANIEAALRSARQDNKRVLIRFGGNWCGGCNRLSDLFESQAEISAILEKSFVVVPVNIDTNTQLFDRYVTQRKDTGFPQLTVIDADARILANRSLADFQVGLKLDAAAVKTFLEKSSASH